MISPQKKPPRAGVGIRNISDYSPFGVLLKERTVESAYFRRGFQGQERDDEVKSDGNSVNFKYRMHDPRVGRFFAVDPLSDKYPYYTPYSFSGNKVINSIELEGLEEYEASRVWSRTATGYSVVFKLIYVLPQNRKDSSPNAGDKDRHADIIINGTRTPFQGAFKRGSIYEIYENRKRLVSKDPNNVSGESLTLKESVNNNQNKYMQHAEKNQQGALIYVDPQGKPLQWTGEESKPWALDKTPVYYSTNGQSSGSQESDAVAKAAKALFYLPEVSITIDGNTSHDGTESFNKNLSVNRVNDMQKRILDYAKSELKATDAEILNMKTRMTLNANGENNATGDENSNNDDDRNTTITFQVEGL